MLAASGLIALAFVEHRRALDEERTLEAVQTTQLQDGWKTLGTLATQESARHGRAERRSATRWRPHNPLAAPTVAAPPPAPVATNIVIVNPPVQAPARNPATANAPAAPAVAVPAPGVSNERAPFTCHAGATKSGHGQRRFPAKRRQRLGARVSPNPALPNGSAPGTPERSFDARSSVPASPPTTGITP